MVNTSATGGYLSPTGGVPLSDAALEDVFQSAVAQITGLAGSMVRPRWQPNPPPQPEASVDWCAIGVQSVGANDGPAFVHSPDGDGSDTSIRHEAIEVIASFYGPNSIGNAARLRDGVAIPQNNEAVSADAGLYFIECSSIIPAPALVNQTWIRKHDIRLTFRRAVSRVYPVLNLLSAHGTISPAVGHSQNFDTEN